MRGRFARPVMAFVVALSAGCGTRVSGTEVLAAAGGGTVGLDPATIAALRRPPAADPGTVYAATRTRGVDKPLEAAPAPAAAPGAARTAGTTGAGPPHRAVARAPAGVGANLSAPVNNVERPATAPGRSTVAAAPAPAAAGCAAPLAPVAVGQVGTFSGVVGALTAGSRAALAAWAKDVNAHGGLACHPVRLYSQDDAGDPGQAAAAVKDLAPDLVPDGEAMLGWTAGKLLEAAVDQLSTGERSGDLTTALILTGLGRIHGETLGGLTGPLMFTPGEKHASSSRCNYFERLGPDGWSTPTGSKPVCH
jgi:hypothetical protein